MWTVNTPVSLCVYFSMDRFQHGKQKGHKYIPLPLPLAMSLSACGEGAHIRTWEPSLTDGAHKKLAR